MNGRKVLFVCVGNICRSPLAAALASLHLIGVEAESAGTHPAREVAHNTVLLAAEMGIDLTGHRPRGIRDVDVDRFDLIVALDETVRRDLTEMLGGTEKLRGWSVPDPYGQSLAVFRSCAVAIMERLSELQQ